jgi:hypothetical protein
MSTGDRLVVPQHVMARAVGDEYVLLDLEKGTYYGLDSVGARIWGLLAKGLELDAVSDRVADEYEVTREQATSDVASLVGALRERGLLEAS